MVYLNKYKYVFIFIIYYIDFCTLD